MFEPTCEFPVQTGAAFLSKNLSVFHHKAKGLTFAAFLGKDAVQLLSWNEKLEKNSCELFGPEEIAKIAGDKKPVSLMQVIDFKTRKRLLMEPLPDIVVLPATNGGNKRALKATPFSRGISCVESLIVAGSNSGELMQIACSGEGSFQAKKNLKATCIFDLITVSGDVAGNVLVWSKNMKSVTKRISTNQQLSVLNILRKQVFCGNLLGQICVYSVLNGALLVELNAHSRQITAIAVATESAYMMSASEDTYVRIWKLHSRNPEAYKIEFRYAQCFENMPLIGAAFSNTRGSGYLITFYENSKLLHFKITRRPSPNPAVAVQRKEGGDGAEIGMTE